MVVRSGESSVRLRNNCNAGVERSQSVTKSGGHSLTNTYHLGGGRGLYNFSDMMVPTRSKTFRKNLWCRLYLAWLIKRGETCVY